MPHEELTRQGDIKLFRLRNKQGLYYSPRATGRSWNRDGKFLSPRQLAQIPAEIKKGTTLETWWAAHVADEPL